MILKGSSPLLTGQLSTNRLLKVSQVPFVTPIFWLFWGHAYTRFSSCYSIIRVYTFPSKFLYIWGKAQLITKVMPTVIIVISNLLIDNKQLPTKFVVSTQLALCLKVSANRFFLECAHEPIMKRVKLNYETDKLGKNQMYQPLVFKIATEYCKH